MKLSTRLTEIEQNAAHPLLLSGAPPPLPALGKEAFSALSRLGDLSRTELFRDRGEEYAKLISWLEPGRENGLVRITGGCLGMDEQLAVEIRDLLFKVFLLDHHDFSGVLCSGSTLAVSESIAGRQRPSMAEIGSGLARYLKDARSIGAFPSAELKCSAGEIQVTEDIWQGERWRILADPKQQRGLLVSAVTPYLWDAEWQGALKLSEDLGGNGPRVLISFDGGRATANELKAWAEKSLTDPRYQLVLISGGGEGRATDTFLAEAGSNPNVHCVAPERGALSALLGSLLR